MEAEKDVEKDAAQETTELTDEQLDEVAGGGYLTVTGSIILIDPRCF